MSGLPHGEQVAIAVQQEMERQIETLEQVNRKQAEAIKTLADALIDALGTKGVGELLGADGRIPGIRTALRLAGRLP